MLRADEKLTFYEGFSLLSMTFLYHVFNEVLPNLVETAGTAAWISRIVSSLFALVYLALLLCLLKRHKNQDFLQICDGVYGRFAAKAVHLILLGYLLLFCAVSLNQAVELLQTYAYSEISALRIDLLMMGAVGVFALYSIKGMGKTVSIFLPLIFATILVVLLLSRRQYDSNLLFPILGYGTKTTVISGLMLGTEFNGLLVLSIFFTSFSDHKGFKKSSLWAIGVTSAVTVFTNLCYNMAVPYNCTQDIMAGILGVAQGNHSSRFVQRMESVFIAVTVMAIILLLGIGFLAVKKVYCHMFAIQRMHDKAVIIPLAGIVICIARSMNRNMALRSAVRIMTRRFGIFLALGLILLTLLVGWVRSLGGGTGRRAAAAAGILVLLCGTLSGCTHYREPDAEIYPLMMGYEKGEKEEYKITMRFMLDTIGEEGEGSGSGEEEGVPKDTIVMEAPSFVEGINMISATIPKKISMLHIKMLVISEEIAQEGVDGFVAPLVRHNEITPTMAFVVCRGSPYDFITAERSNLTDSLQLDMELILETNKETTSYYVVSISEFLYNYRSTYGDAAAMLGGVSGSHYREEPEEDAPPEDAIAQAPGDYMTGYLAGGLPQTGDNKMELAGMAVFRYDKMVGMLTTRECAIIMMLNGALDSASFSVPDMYDPEEYTVSFTVREVQPVSYSTWVDESGKAHVEIYAPLNAEVGTAQNPQAAYQQDPGEQDKLQEYLALMLEERANGLMEKLQTEYRSDVLQVGRRVARNFPTIQEWEEYDWAERYPEAEINIIFYLNM